MESERRLREVIDEFDKKILKETGLDEIINYSIDIPIPEQEELIKNPYDK